MARLYPPITEEVLSAFCLTYDDEKQEKIGASIKIDFNLNRAVANAEISGMALRLRTISTNQYVITENLNVNENTGKSEGNALSYSLEDGTCLFQITNTYNQEAVDALKVGQFYKAQIAFLDLSGNVGYWSTVATIKCVAEPIVHIPNYTKDDANVFSNEVIGEYVQSTFTGDSSEKEYSYRFQLFDDQGTIIEDTGIRLHNSSSDIESNSSTDSFYCYKELNEDQSYYLIYSVTTINGLSISSPKYQIIISESIEPEDDITLMVSNGQEENFPNDRIKPWEEGLIKIYPDLNGYIHDNITPSGENKAITGNFVILRSSSKDNFGSWQEVRRFRLNNEKPYTKVIYDYTVEQGITYRYAIQQYNRQQFYSKKVYAYKRNIFNGEVITKNNEPVYNDITADFEDMFLYDGKRQLKVRFNPKVNSFKNDLQEQKIDTIGSKHPFIFRNGNVCYKEFPISGLISFQIDNAELFMTDEDYKQMNLSRFEANDIPRDPDYYTEYQALGLDEFNQAINDDIPLYRKVGIDKEVISATGHENKLSKKKQFTTVYSYQKISNRAEARDYYNAGWTIYKKVENIKDSTTSLDNRVNIDYTEPITYNKFDLTSDNIMSERYFKLLVLDWLTDGKPKLFRSPTEGNYIVRLLNVSLTPKTELGRMIHEFTCTAYEIADFNYQSLRDLGILSVEDISEVETQSFTRTIKDLLDANEKTQDGYYKLNLDDKELAGFQCTGFAPGDKIRILVADSPTPIDITIGTSGTYIYDEGKNIVTILFAPTDTDGDFPRNILLSTEGYTNQWFDTIASISTHTQMGEQLVGPVVEYFGETAVGSAKKNNVYYKSANVSLYDKFTLVNKYQEKTLTEDTFIPDTYYYLDGTEYKLAKSFDSNIIYYEALGNKYSPNTYYIPTNDGYVLCQDKDYNNNLSYYSHVTDGKKLKISEILHLHAKKREVIPIFLNGVSLEYPEEARFMVTPFGQGYIRSKSIISSDMINWSIGLGNLSDEELVKERTIQEIVEFFISKCNRDIFCLFEIYIPTENGWITLPESHYSGTPTSFIVNAQGIYDPWLYNWQQNHKNNNNIRENYNGWWPKKDGDLGTILPNSNYGAYDPTMTFVYSNKENVVISLAEKEEITLENIQVPDSITIGNGVVMEPIYRLQCIDYTVENENSALKKIKDNYLLVKEQATKDLLQYFAASYAKTNGDILLKKYEAELQKILDYENYKSVIALLTNNARQEQIDKLVTDSEAQKSYLTNEKKLVDIIMLQLQNLDYDMLDALGNIYENDTSHRIYGKDSLLFSYNKKYQEAYNQLKEAESDTIIPQIIEYLQYIPDYELAKSVSKDDVGKIIYHIQQHTNYNFADGILQLIDYINNNISITDKELSTLGEKRFVGQYLDTLTKNMQEILFGDLTTAFDKLSIKNEAVKEVLYQLLQESDGQEVPLAYLCYKKDKNNEDIFSLKETNLSDSNAWDDSYFLLSTEQLPNIILSEPSSESTSDYIINYNNYWDREEELPINQSSKIFSIYKENRNILEAIKYYLEKSNDWLHNGGNEQQRISTYNTNYQPYSYNYGMPYQFTNYELGRYNSYAVSKTQLERLIDTVYLNNSKATIDDIISYLSTQTIYSRLPETDIENNMYNIKECLKNYIDAYITPDNENNISPRDIYQQICGCVTYRDEHPSLTEDQLQVIRDTIDMLSMSEPYASFKQQVGGQIATKNIIEKFTKWQEDYNNITNGANAENVQNLKKAVQDFNGVVAQINSLMEYLSRLIERYKKFSNNEYKVTDNIQELLWEEKNHYIIAKQELTNIRQTLIAQLETIQSNAFFDGYFDFIYSYVMYNSIDITKDKNKYTQLLDEAQAMAKAIVDENKNPYKLQAKIDLAWKQYLDALAKVYYNEIKERFN